MLFLPALQGLLQFYLQIGAHAQELDDKFVNLVADHGIDYAQCGLLRSYRYVLAHLREVSVPSRPNEATLR